MLKSTERKNGIYSKAFKSFYFVIGFILALILAIALGSFLIDVLDNLISRL